MSIHKSGQEDGLDSIAKYIDSTQQPDWNRDFS